MDFDEMPAGREMDSLVAEHAMGRHCFCDADPANCEVHHPDVLLPYSTDIEAAWQVMDELGLSLICGSDKVWHCGRFDLWFEVGPGDLFDWIYGNDEGVSYSAPLAICRAALKIRGTKSRWGAKWIRYIREHVL